VGLLWYTSGVHDVVGLLWYTSGVHDVVGLLWYTQRSWKIFACNLTRVVENKSDLEFPICDICIVM